MAPLRSQVGGDKISMARASARAMLLHRTELNVTLHGRSIDLRPAVCYHRVSVSGENAFPGSLPAVLELEDVRGSAGPETSEGRRGQGMREPTRDDHRAEGAARILIVQADRNLRTMLELAFAYDDSGYQVYTAPDGRSALLQLEIIRPDVVMLEVSVADGEGWVTLDRIREVSNVPVIALSVVDDPRIAIESAKRGADHFALPGPRIRELQARVRALLGQADRPDTPTWQRIGV